MAVRLDEYKDEWFMYEKNYLNVNTTFMNTELIEKHRMDLKEDWV